MVDPEEGRGPGSGTRERQPVHVIQGPVGIQQQPVEDITACLPTDVEISTRQEAGDSVTCQVVHPTRASELPHRRINVGIACPHIDPHSL